MNNSNPVENYTILKLWIKAVHAIPTLDNQTWYEIYKEVFENKVRENTMKSLGVFARFLPKQQVEMLIQEQMKQLPIETIVQEILNQQIQQAVLAILAERKKAIELRQRGATRDFVKSQLYETMQIPDGKGALEVLTPPRLLILKMAYIEMAHLVRLIKKHNCYFDGAFDDYTSVLELLTDQELDELADMLDRNEKPARIATRLIHSRITRILEKEKKRPISERRLQNLLQATPDVYHLKIPCMA